MKNESEFEVEKKPKGDILARKCSSSRAIFELDEVQAIKDAIQEHILFIGMDGKNNIRSIRLIGVGSNNVANIDSKEITRTALLTASEKIVLVHNHPNNSLEPSKPDKYITNYTSKLLNVFNIDLIDHIIVTEKDYHSMGKYNEINYDFSDYKLNFVENVLIKEENEKLKAEIKNRRNQRNKQINDR